MWAEELEGQRYRSVRQGQHNENKGSRESMLQVGVMTKGQCLLANALLDLLTCVNVMICPHYLGRMPQIYIHACVVRLACTCTQTLTFVHKPQGRSWDTVRPLNVIVLLELFQTKLAELIAELSDCSILHVAMRELIKLTGIY